MRVLLLLISLCVFPVVLHAAPEPYGKRFIEAARALGAADGGAVPGSSQSPEEQRAQAVALRERVERLEQRSGPYAPALGEAFGDLARVLEAGGAYAEADRYRERALHLVRVNEGLYSPTQGPLVRASLASLRRRGDYEGLDARYAYFFRLYGSARPPFNELRWTATLEYLRWQREAVLRGIDGDPRRRLLDLYDEHQALLRTLLENPDEQAQRIFDATMSQLATLYLISDREPPRELTLMARGGLVRRDDPADFDLLQERLDNLQRVLRNRGKLILEEALEAMPAGARRQRLALRLALGDWFLWQGATNSAAEAYAQVWADAAGAAEEALVADWFEDPVPLPASEAFVIADRPAGPIVRAKIDVTDVGRALVSTEGFANPPREETRLRRTLQAARFRPAYRDGRPVRTQGMVSSWVLLEE